MKREVKVTANFPCWCCGGKTVKLYKSCTRYCGTCEVMELRLEEELTREEDDLTPDGDPYVDHSVTHLPSPG